MSHYYDMNEKCSKCSENMSVVEQDYYIWKLGYSEPLCKKCAEKIWEQNGYERGFDGKYYKTKKEVKR